MTKPDIFQEITNKLKLAKLGAIPRARKIIDEILMVELPKAQNSLERPQASWQKCSRETKSGYVRVR